MVDARRFFVPHDVMTKGESGFLGDGMRGCQQSAKCEEVPRVGGSLHDSSS